MGQTIENKLAIKNLVRLSLSVLLMNQSKMNRKVQYLFFLYKFSSFCSYCKYILVKLYIVNHSCMKDPHANSLYGAEKLLHIAKANFFPCAGGMCVLYEGDFNECGERHRFQFPTFYCTTTTAIITL